MSRRKSKVLEIKNLTTLKETAIDRSGGSCHHLSRHLSIRTHCIGPKQNDPTFPSNASTFPQPVF